MRAVRDCMIRHTEMIRAVRIHILFSQISVMSELERARRKPLLLFVFDGVLLFRLATRQFVALLFQLPPRRTR